jgi:6-phosphogluconolactonase
MVPKTHRLRTLGEIHLSGTHLQTWILLSTFGLVFVLLLMNGCSGGMKPSVAQGPTASFAFIANSGSGNVSAFAVGSNGVLSSVPGSPFSAGLGAEFMALDSVHKFLYVSNQNSDNLSGFSVNTSTGSLTPVPGSPFTTDASPHGVVVGGKLCLCWQPEQWDDFRFQYRQRQRHAHPGSRISLYWSYEPVWAGYQSCRNVFVRERHQCQYRLSIDPKTGALTAVPGAASPTGQTPIGILADPNSKFLYVGDHMQDTISGYSIGPESGALTRISGPAVASTGCPGCHMNTRPLRLIVHPMSNFAYASNVAANTLSVFGLNNGILSPISAPVPTGQHPFGVALDPGGSFLYVVNKVDNTISAFSVDPRMGTLSPLPGNNLLEAEFRAAGSCDLIGVVMDPIEHHPDACLV